MIRPAPSAGYNVSIQSFSAPRALEFQTGVAGFIGSAFAVGTPPTSLPDPSGLDSRQPYASWSDFVSAFCEDKRWRNDHWVPDELLWNAVQGYFQNGGVRCWVVFYDLRDGDPSAAIEAAMAKLATIDDVDLVCAPSLLGSANANVLQQQLIRSFELPGRRADWFLLLDPPDASADLPAWYAALRAAPIGHPENIAVYYPWVTLGWAGGEIEPPPLPSGVEAKPRVPASGHVAGIFARTDREVGVHKPPANANVEGIVDVDSVVDWPWANPLRVLPGRGIRVWGARTLAGGSAPDARAFVNVRRLLLTLERWLIRALDWVVFEANDFRLWVRLQRELNAKLNELYLQGAFAGATPSEAFGVKCDADNNPDDVRAAGKLQVDIRVAPIVPKEFVQIRVIRNADGTR